MIVQFGVRGIPHAHTHTIGPSNVTLDDSTIRLRGIPYTKLAFLTLPLDDSTIRLRGIPYTKLAFLTLPLDDSTIRLR